MTNVERFITENPEHPAVISLVGITNRMALNSRVAQAFSKVCQLADEAYGPCPSLERMRHETAQA